MAARSSSQPLAIPRGRLARPLVRGSSQGGSGRDDALLELAHGDRAEVLGTDGGGLRVTLPCPPLLGPPLLGPPRLGPPRLGAGHDERTNVERWGWRTPTAAPLRVLRSGRVQAVRSGDLLAGAAVFAADPLEEEVTSTYASLLALLESEGLHLVRLWNAVPRIGERTTDGESQVLDRYMRFCRARAQALEARLGPGFATQLSAASAVGATGTRGCVAFLAAAEPGRAVSNPRQEEAWRYPARFGPRSPSFARATRLPARLGGALLVSGTASIVGCDSLHEGQPERQLDETLSNLRALLAADAGRQEPRSDPLSRLRHLRVYLAAPELLPGLRGRLLAPLHPAARVSWVHAPICRPELCIEIEGVAV